MIEDRLWENINDTLELAGDGSPTQPDLFGSVSSRRPVDHDNRVILVRTLEVVELEDRARRSEGQHSASPS